MCKKGKKILILGNGFDLAHGLPTNYTDFLKFCTYLERIYSYRIDGDYTKQYEDSLTEWTINQEIKEILLSAFKSRKLEQPVVSDNRHIEEMHNCLIRNVWYSYFKSLVKDSNITIGINWIDFESEISYVIQAIDKKANTLLMT